MNIEETLKDESRLAFEKFRDKRNALLESEGKKPGSKWHVTNAHYPTWQASRAAIEVELPKHCDKDEHGCAVYSEEGPFFHCHDMIEAIESLGLKVKS